MGLGEFQDGHAAARLRHAHHLGQAAIRIGDVAESERHGRQLKGIVGEGQALGVGFDVADTSGGAAAPGLGTGRKQHRQTEIGADDRHPPLRRPVISEREIAGAGANIENGGRYADSRNMRRRQLRCSPTPVAVDVQTKQVIKQIVAVRDVAEHRADAYFALVEQIVGHARCLRYPLFPQRCTMREGGDAPLVIHTAQDG